MTATIIAIPILVLLSIIQSALLSQFRLLNGMPDLVLLVLLAWTLQKRVTTAIQWGIIAGLITQLFSAVPLGVPVVSYLLSIGLALYLRTRDLAGAYPGNVHCCICRNLDITSGLNRCIADIRLCNILE